MRKARVAVLVAFGALGVGGLVLQGCTGDDTTVEPKKDSGTDATVPPPPPPPPPNEGGPGGDAGDAGPTTINYTVPSGGGSVDVQGTTQVIRLTFPASAGGVNVTISVSDPTAIGWGAGQFTDVLKLGPAGTRFADPVVVRPTSKSSLLFTFPDGTTKAPGEPVPYSATANGYLLKHFSALVLAPPGKYCDNEIYNDTPNSGRCDLDSGFTTFRQLQCQGWNFCMIINGACCVGADAGPPPDGGTGCTTDNQRYAFGYYPTENTNGGQYPYCAFDAGDWDGGDAGCNPGTTSYDYQGDGGCGVYRQCGPGYSLTCGGGTCTCRLGGQDAGSFAQGTTTCDNLAGMKTAYVQGCNFPPN